MGERHLIKRLAAECKDEKRHYKLYKRGKVWVVAGISVLFAGTMYLQQPETTHAATAGDGDATTQSDADGEVGATVQLRSSAKTVQPAPAVMPQAAAGRAPSATRQTESAASTAQSAPASVQSGAGQRIAPEPAQSQVSLTVTYVDDDDDQNPIQTEQITGPAGKTGTYRPSIPGYLNMKLADDQADQVAYTLSSGDTDNITVHLVHLTQDFSPATTTRTITFQDENGNQVSDPVVQTVTWKISRDLYTNHTVYTPESAGYDAVPITVPSGFTSNYQVIAAETFPANPTALPASENYTVLFSRIKAPASATVKFVDDDENGKQVGTTDTINGHVGDTGTYRVTRSLPDYDLAKGQLTALPYTLTGDGSDDLTIHLVHRTDDVHFETFRLITYFYEDATRAKDPVRQTIKWTGTQDRVTEVSTYTPSAPEYTAVPSGTIDGYTADPATVPAEPVPATVELLPDEDFPLNSEGPQVVFKKNKAAATVTYVDDAEGGVKVATDTINGRLGDTGTYDAANYLANSPLTEYVLAKDQLGKHPYTLTSDDTDNFVVHLTHRIDHISGVTERVITYSDESGHQLSAPVTQRIKWEASRDRVTGEGINTPNPVGYAAVISPLISGYIADQQIVPAEAENANTSGVPARQTVAVVYHTKAETAKVLYVDDTQGDTQAVKIDTIYGHYGDQGDDHVQVPANYALAKGQLAKVPYTLTDSVDDNLIVHLTHQVADATVETKRTIHYIFENGTQALPDKIQTIKWGVSKDLVTGQSIATPLTAYFEVISPSIAGYSAIPTTVNQEAPAPLADASQLKDEPVIVTYVANATELAVTYVERGQAGQPNRVIKTDMVTGKVGDNGEYLPFVPKGYEAANFIPGKAIAYTLTPWANGITLYLNRDENNATPGGSTTPGGNPNPSGSMNPGGNTTPGGSTVAEHGGAEETTQDTGRATNDGRPQASKIHETASQAQSNPETVNLSRKQATTLPKTGDEAATAVTLLGVSLLSLLGLAARKRRVER